MKPGTAAIFAVSLPLITGVILFFGTIISDIKENMPLTGPCNKREASTKIYDNLAVSVVIDRLHPFSVRTAKSTQETVDRMQNEINKLRENWLPTITDSCMAYYTNKWLKVYERMEARKLKEKEELGEYDSQYEKSRATEEDQKRALAARLGIPYSR